MVTTGSLLHLALGYLYVASGLVVPGFFLFLLWAGWGALAALALFLVRSGRPRLVLAVPVAAAALWLAMVPGLGSLLNWTP